MSTMMPLQPEQSYAHGRFVLVKRLGSGGMGEVWLARDERLQEQVALKFLPQAIRGDQAALHDLRRETTRSHKLSHPNIVCIHDLHEDPDGMAFIVMEYVDGPTLAALRIQQPLQVLSWAYLRPALAQLCAALDYAHSEHVIHRDLKPANLMVDGEGRLKLADFGIAAVASDSASRVSQPHSNSGTWPYMSPQQLAGKWPQASDDLYALGVTLYELLTSKLPFHSGDITHQILHEPPEPLEERLAALGIANEIPGEAAALIMACLAKEPAQRPQSARAVAERIGLEVIPKSSLNTLSHDVFSEAQPSEQAPVGPEIESAASARPSSGKKSLWAASVFSAILLLAAGGWYWTKQTQGTKSPPSKRQTESSEINIPTAPQESAAGPLQASSASAPPAVGINQHETWTFTTIAGKAGIPGAIDGIASGARFDWPIGIAVNEEGDIYVVEYFLQTVRLINPSGAVSTLAGLAGTAGSSDGVGALARFRRPSRIAVDRSGNVYLTDTGNHTIRKITPSGTVTTLAGHAGSSGSADGAESSARFNWPSGIAAAPDGNIFVADAGNSTIRKITPAGLISAVAGQAGVKGSTDGPGPSALFNDPHALTVGAQGFVYVTDSGNNTIRVIEPSGGVSTLAGQAGVAGSEDGVTTNAQFKELRDIAVDSEGNLYVAEWGNNTIRQITSGGAVITIGGLAGHAGSMDGAGTNSRFNKPEGLALDHQGNIYVTDPGNHTIRKGHRQQAAPPEPATYAANSRLPMAPIVQTAKAPASLNASGGIIRLGWLASGAGKKLGYRDKGFNLSPVKPDSIQVVPPDLASPLYGQFQLGPAEAPTTFFVILDEPEGRPSRLFVDANANGNLTDDPPTEWHPKTYLTNGVQRTSDFYTGGATVVVAYGSEKLKLHLNIFQAGKSSLWYIRDYGRAGEISFGADTYRALLLDELATGDFRTPRGDTRFTINLLLDLKHSGKYEYFDATKPFSIGGATYEVKDMSASGGTFRLVKSSKTAL